MFKAIKHWLWVHDIDDITLCCWGAIASFVLAVLAMVARLILLILPIL